MWMSREARDCTVGLHDDMSKSNRGGIRINVVVVAGVLGLLAMLFLVFAGTQSPEAAAQQFMESLATKDVDRLVELSYLEGADPPLREQWDRCVNHAARNFVFMWQFLGSERVSEDEYVIKVVLMVFRGPMGAEGDVVNLPLKRINGQWKVVLNGLDRSFFPYLPS